MFLTLTSFLSEENGSRRGGYIKVILSVDVAAAGGSIPCDYLTHNRYCTRLSLRYIKQAISTTKEPCLLTQRKN